MSSAGVPAVFEIFAEVLYEFVNSLNRFTLLKYVVNRNVHLVYDARMQSIIMRSASLHRHSYRMKFDWAASLT